MIGIHTLFIALVLATPAIAQVLLCPSTAPTDTITIAGSTAVQPIAIAWGAAYNAQCGATVTVQGGGSRSGAKRVCGDTTTGTAVDIGAMSRKWKSIEATAGTPAYTYQCLIGTTPTVVQIDAAIDGLVVILKKSSLPQLCITALGGLTFHQLRWIFSSYTAADLTATGWLPSSLPNSDGNENTHLFSELSAACPAIEIKLVGPNYQFGAHTHFLETILTDNAYGETYATTPTRPVGAGYFGTTSDIQTIKKVMSDSTGASIGFVSYSTYRNFLTTIYGVPLKNTGGYKAPIPSLIASGSYPLTRRIYMNVLSSTVLKTKAFIEYGMSTMGTANVVAKGFFPIPTSERAPMLARL